MLRSRTRPAISQTLTATYKVDAGEDVTCIFTNQKRSLIIVKKVTDPDGAGGDQCSPSRRATTQTSRSPEGEQNVSPELLPGNYSVTENTPDGWELESATCDNGDDPSDIDLPATTVVTCTFINTPTDAEHGTIIVKKVTQPAGDDTEFDFDFGEPDFALADGEQETFDDLAAGYLLRLRETRPRAGTSPRRPAPTRAIPAEIELSAGETVTCTFTNTKRGTIIVEKQTSPDATQGSFSFTGDAAGSIGDGEPDRRLRPEPGTYCSTEGAAAGWLLTAIECDDEESSGNLGTRTATFQLDAGETVKCVFTNAKQTVGKGSIDVQKSASPTSLKEPGGPVDVLRADHEHVGCRTSRSRTSSTTSSAISTTRAGTAASTFRSTSGRASRWAASSPRQVTGTAGGPDARQRRVRGRDATSSAISSRTATTRGSRSRRS